MPPVGELDRPAVCAEQRHRDGNVAGEIARGRSTRARTPRIRPLSRRVAVAIIVRVGPVHRGLDQPVHVRLEHVAVLAAVVRRQGRGPQAAGVDDRQERGVRGGDLEPIPLELVDQLRRHRPAARAAGR